VGLEHYRQLSNLTLRLIFPRWDVIAIILSIFLLTYTYIEARSNYHRGSILVLAYVFEALHIRR
jgi:Ca2+/H+ antiporter